MDLRVNTLNLIFGVGEEELSILEHELRDLRQMVKLRDYLVQFPKKLNIVIMI